MKKIIKDVCGAYIEENNQILIAQRDASDTFPLKWEFPGGSVEEGESKEECIKRELIEEIGVVVNNLRLIGVFEDEIPTLKIIIYLYNCNIAKGIPKAIECKDVKWVKFEDLENFDLAQADRKIYNYLKKNYYGKDKNK